MIRRTEEPKTNRQPQNQKKQIEAKGKSTIHNKRVSITSFMNNLARNQKKPQDNSLSIEVSGPAHCPLKIQEKDQRIRELQEQIINKKLKNDMIQDAFRNRQQSQDHYKNYPGFLETLTEGCKMLASCHKDFKRSLFKILLAILRFSKKNKGKTTKMFLVWIIGWVTHLFTFLSSTLIKR